MPKNFQLIETRNKEIGLVLRELDELAWRLAGMFDDREVDTIKKMFSIQRNADYFDMQFYDNDMKSMKEFIDNANFYDDRIELLEEWVIRKEDEYKSRVVTPPKAMQKSDYELNGDIDKNLKRARESIVAKMLEKDEFGMDQQPKAYKDLTTRELERISESICVRLNLFSTEYPAFMP